MRVTGCLGRHCLLTILTIAALVGAQAGADAQGAWEPLAKFPMKMEEPVGVAVGGKLYILAGLGGAGFVGLGVVYTYDPTTNAWTQKNPMPIKAHHIMATEYNGKIYVFGGFVQPGNQWAWRTVDSSWEYSPDTDTWKALAPLPTKRGAGAAVVLDGKIHVIGGAAAPPGVTDPTLYFDGRPHVTIGTHEVYDPATNNWTTRAPMPTSRNHFLAAAVGGKIYVIGGRIGSAYVTRSSNTDVVEEYDPARDMWSLKAPMPTARSGVAGGVYKGKIYVAGGEYRNEKIMAAYRAFEAYDPATNRWQDMPSMRVARHGFGGAILGNRFHAVAGDIQAAPAIAGFEVYTDSHDVFDFEK